MYKSLSHFISELESAGELIRVTEYVSPRLEITEIADRFVKNNGKALLFENNGTEFPLLINAFASERRMCMALGVKKLDDIGGELHQLLKEFLGPKETLLEKLKVLPLLKDIASWMPRSSGGKGSCQEIVMKNPDLSKLPVMTCWPGDGGPFVTLPVVHTKDPETGFRNVGMYRMQIFGPALTGMHWHLHKGSANHYRKYQKLNRRMPVTVTLGGDPAYTFSATAPLPENVDEYLLAGFLRKKRVELVRCLTNDLEVPDDVDFVIEGYVEPSEELILEGPFGDHTGFYSLADYYPGFHVTCITHRRNAVYPSTIVGIPPMEDVWIGKATERIFLTPIRMTSVPELKDMIMPEEGVFHNLVLARIEKTYPGQGPRVMNSLWGAGQMMFNKIMIVTDSDTALDDYQGLARLVTASVNLSEDIHFMKGPLDVLDHSSRMFAYGSKMGVDATGKTGTEVRQGGDRVPSPFIDVEKIIDLFPEVGGVNGSWLSDGISLVTVSVKKTRRGQIRELSREIFRISLIVDIKFIIFVDEGVDIRNPRLLTWLVSNNIDPMRDCFLSDPAEGKGITSLIIDGTRKTRELDDFGRDWPNIITMDDEIIRNIDRKWESLTRLPLIPSPSHMYKPLVSNSGAVS